jgi:hypothetical protein
MEQSDRSGREPSEADLLRRLEERLERASTAAERLIAEAARASASSAGRLADAAERAAGASGGDRERGSAADDEGGSAGDDEGGSADASQEPPPAGWAAPGGAAGRSVPPGELDALVNFLRSVRDLVPPELQRRLAEAVRELLLALRALIDWYLERSERTRRETPEVRDIPIL